MRGRWQIVLANHSLRGLNSKRHYHNMVSLLINRMCTSSWGGMTVMQMVDWHSLIFVMHSCLLKKNLQLICSAGKASINVLVSANKLISSHRLGTYTWEHWDFISLLKNLVNCLGNACHVGLTSMHTQPFPTLIASKTDSWQLMTSAISWAKTRFSFRMLTWFNWCSATTQKKMAASHTANSCKNWRLNVCSNRNDGLFSSINY